MQRFFLSTTLLALATGCTPAEDLENGALQARLAGNELRFESETDETIVISLRTDMTGTARDILPSDRPDRVDQIIWAVEGGNLCLTSQISSPERKECAAVSIAGSRVTIDAGSEPLIGTISPL